MRSSATTIELQLYREMLAIRRFEETVLELFSQGKLNGTTHACIGQEHISAGLFAHLSRADVVFSNHRCHGHYLAHQKDQQGLMAELLGRSTGTCGGVGGSQHLHRGNFYSNGVQGGIVPAAVGMALAERLKGEREAIAVVFLGDGTLGQGQVYEAFNLAALWKLPVLFVVEHNGYSQSTPSRLQIAGQVEARPGAFGIDVLQVTSNRVLESYEVAGAAVHRVREQREPMALIYHTFRLCSHSRSDDGRSPEVIEPWRLRDPILLSEAELTDLCGPIREEVERELLAVLAEAEGAPLPASLPPVRLARPARMISGSSQNGEKVVQALNRALHRLLREDPLAVVVGMDILDPYGGAFKVEKGLSTAFPERVIPTPVCETSLTGLCGGMALRGLHPVLQIMFGDFLTLGVEPLVNYISKYRAMYNDQVRCPVVIRTPMGGRRGYGPTHSQSLEKLLLGIPDLRVVALSPFHDPEALLLTAVMEDEAPVLLVENKALYGRPLQLSDSEGWCGSFAVQTDELPYAAVRLSPTGFRRADLALVTYGGMAEIAAEAAEKLLLEHELSVEVVVVAELAPFDPDCLEASLVRAGGRLLTAEEGTLPAGWGAEVVAACAERGWLRGRVGRVAARNTPVPAARELEEQVLPQVADVVRAALALRD